MSSAIAVGIVTGVRRHDVIRFIDAEYQKIFGTTPPESDVYFAAYDTKHAIIGTMALDFCGPDGRMPLARIYDFDEDGAPFPVAGSLGAQVGRWIAKTPAASGPLLHYAATYALTIGKEYGWCEHNRAVHRRAENLGIPFKPVPNATLDLERVSDHNRAFYAHTCASKPMALYMMSLEDMCEGLAARNHASYARIEP